MRMILWLLLAYVGYRIVTGFLAGRGKPKETRTMDTETFRDPVCGIYVSADDAVIGNNNGQRLYFCSMNCLDKYRERLTTEHYHQS